MDSQPQRLVRKSANAIVIMSIILGAVATTFTMPLARSYVSTDKATGWLIDPLIHFLATSGIVGVVLSFFIWLAALMGVLFLGRKMIDNRTRGQE